MSKITLQLSNNDDVVSGYETGNFIVYRGRYYWHIAHKSGATLLGDFKRRKDAAACANAADHPLWDFEDPAGDEFGDAQDELCRRWYDARNQCTTEDRFSSILMWEFGKPIDQPAKVN